MSITILIDGNSVGYCEHHATKLKSGDLETQAIFGYVRRMREAKIGYPECKPLVLWDGRAQWRYDLCPTYKSNRESDPKKIAFKASYQEQKPYIMRAMTALGIDQVTASTHEADDLAGYFTAKLTAKPENRVVLMTGDHDWFQLVRPNVQVRDIRDPSFFLTSRNFFERTGYMTPIAFLEGKALQGDSSDVIPGVGGFGEKTAMEFLAQWGSVFNFWHQVDSGNAEPQRRKGKTAKTPHPEELLVTREGRRAFAKNLKLMQLINVAQPDPKDIQVVRGKANKDQFAELCEELNFTSYLRDLDKFFLPFEK